MRINTIIGGRSWKSCKIYDVPNKAIILCALAFRFISNISLGSCLFVDGEVVNANYREWPQIVLEMVCHKYLIVFCWAVILLTRSSIFCIVLLPRRGFSCITAARNAVWFNGFQPHWKWLYHRINFYSQTINISPIKQCFTMTAFNEIREARFGCNFQCLKV